MLSRQWALEDIDDVGAFVGAIANKVSANLRWHEREDLHAYLIAETWELHQRWNQDATPSFKQYASYILKLRVVDHCRRERGRSKWVFGNGYSHERERPQLLSLDAPAEPGGSPLGELVPARTGDPADNCGPACGGLLTDRDRNLDGDLRLLGLEAPGRVAIRAAVNGGGARKTTYWQPPADLLERLEASAEENCRSVQRELTFAVECYLDELERVAENGDVPR